MKKEKEKKKKRWNFYIKSHSIYIKSGIHIFVSQTTLGYYDHGFHVTELTILFYKFYNTNIHKNRKLKNAKATNWYRKHRTFFFWGGFNDS
jgi:hypothetical protein